MDGSLGQLMTHELEEEGQGGRQNCHTEIHPVCQILITPYPGGSHNSPETRVLSF
jgi:hypothetical protein